jgi:hypothetical protein
MAEIPDHVKVQADKAMADSKADAAWTAKNAQESRNFERGPNAENIASIEKAATPKGPDKG